MKKTLIIVSGLLLLTAGIAGAREVPINPITSDVKDKIRESVKLVNNVDEQVAPKVKELEKIFELYKPCIGREEDRGCVQLKDQISEKYGEVLEALGDALPKIRHTIQTTAQGLGGSIETKTRRKDVKELYENISTKPAAPKVRGPLSKKLSQLLTALGGSSNMSILELSLQTQADLISASDTVEFLESKVSQMTLMVELGQELPILSQEMASVMKGVAELFGYDLDFIPEVEMVDTHGSFSADDWRN
jgi:hypothetical protein